MTFAATTRSILAVISLATANLAVPALAETRSTVHDISKATFVSNCSDMGGEVIDNGGAHAGCNLPSGTSVVCSFEDAGSENQSGVCEVSTRTARTDFRHLLGEDGQSMTTGQVPESLTSSGSESSPAVIGGSSGGGKGSFAGGADYGPTSMGDGGPAVQ